MWNASMSFAAGHCNRTP